MDVRQKVAAFFEAYPVRTFAKRELLLRAEEPVEKVFYVVDGVVNQYDITPAGNEVVVNVFKAGAFFLMSSAINRTENHYFFEAGARTQVREAPAADAVQFLHANPDVQFDLLARVYLGVDGVLRRMAHLMGGDAQSRLIFEIINATSRFGEPQADGATFVALTENDLAKRSGLARETVNRLLQGLKASGTVEIGRGGLTVRNTKDLENQLGTDL